MPLQEHLEVRPRSTGEILDDAWRLYFADLPLLLALSGLFLLPAAAALLWLLAQPIPESLTARLLLPALAAVLLPLTGLGAGACQEAFHCRAEEHAPSLGECLGATCRRGLAHVTSQALFLALPFAALLWFAVPGLPTGARWLLAIVFLALFAPVWMAGLGRHAALAAGQKSLWRAWRHSIRASGRHGLRALLLMAVRIALLLFAVLNLHLFVRFFLWAAADLGGFDVALPRLLASPANPAYVVALFAVAWWLLAPHAEAVNYYFFVDARTRYEGLDLRYRVEELFPLERPREPLPEPTRGLPTVVAPAVALLILLLPSAAAAEPVAVVREARQEIAAVRRQVKDANPYRDGRRWAAELRRLGERLDREGVVGKAGYRWYHRAVEGFADLPQPQAVQALDRMEGRLGLIEESLTLPPGQKALTAEEVKKLVSPESRRAAPKPRVEEPPPKKEEKKVEREPPEPRGFRMRGGGGMVGGAGVAAGAANVLIVVLIGLAVAAIAVGVVLLVAQWRKSPRPTKPRREGAAGPEAADVLDAPDQQDPGALWRQTDDLARAGNFLGAVRSLYLSVLALLHQAGLIRWERTRTNGEYADELRPRLALHGPFCRLTGLFEAKWYGERACAEADYRTCRGLGEELRQATEERPVG